CHDAKYVDLGLVVAHECDESEFVSADVKDAHILSTLDLHLIGLAVCRFNVREVSPTRLRGNLEPLPQRRYRAGPLRAEFPQRTPSDYPHEFQFYEQGERLSIVLRLDDSPAPPGAPDRQLFGGTPRSVFP